MRRRRIVINLINFNDMKKEEKYMKSVRHSHSIRIKERKEKRGEVV
jgi:hypothetical protein